MPIVDVTLIGADPRERPGLARRLADALGVALDAPVGATWVRVHRVAADDYAEHGGAPEGAGPVFVDLLRRAWPAAPAEHAASHRAVAEAVAAACDRPLDRVHVLSAPPAEGRVAFGGGELAPAARHRVSSGAPWEATVGYSRAVRVGDAVFVTGTTALTPDGGHAPDDDAYAQAAQCLENIRRALAPLGAGLEHVVRTRLFVTRIADDWEAVGRAHAERFGETRPATTMVEVRALIAPWMRVEIEADAVVR